MNGIQNYLHLLVNGNKTAKVTAKTVDMTPTGFTTELDPDLYFRKRLYVYNNSHPASGECYYAFSNVSGELNHQTGYPLPLGAEAEIRVAQTVEIFFAAYSGEVGDLRIMEIA